MDGDEYGLHWLEQAVSTAPRGESFDYCGKSHRGAWAGREGHGGDVAQRRLSPCGQGVGPGWKVSPCATVPAGETFEIASVEGPGVIRHIWIAHRKEHLRDLVLRVYYDGQAEPSIAVPVGDFFCQAWGGGNQVNGVLVNVNSSAGMNSFWPMPFRKHIRMTVENDSATSCEHFFYTVDYTLEDVAEDELHLHASWRRENPTEPGRDLLIADISQARGHYVGTFLAWQQNCAGWWGEGEVKMFIDDDGPHPTICGTGTEDYFLGAWCFAGGDYSAPYAGFATLHGENTSAGARMAMYRFHMPDPVFFRTGLRVTCQALGWRSNHRYLQLADDIAATAWWYQSLPTSPLPSVGTCNFREQI